ncbi:hypothetical protein JCM3770_000794 [Rhodotorula araucariae]
MAERFRQTPAETKRHQQILNDFIRSDPANRVCVDCKRHDARWACLTTSGLLCLRCSGIHRGLGVHISRVRSIDLDTWTPQQIDTFTRWGNKRVNAYWEAHLKPGHVPPDHKIESFIRSKYELRRWAMDGPIPEPETLDGPALAQPAESAPVPSASPAPASSRKAAATTSIDLLSAPPSSSSSSGAPPRTSSRGGATPAAPTVTAANKPEASLFDLDFGAPAPAASAPAPKRDPKADILSLFAATPAPAPAAAQHAAHGSVAGLAGGLAGLSFGSSAPAPPVPSASAGFSAGWGGATSTASPPSAASGTGGFGDFSSAPAVGTGAGTDPWAATGPAAAAGGLWGAQSPPPPPPPPPPSQKADPFAEFGAFASSSTSPYSSSTAAGFKPAADGFGADIWGASSATTGTGTTTATNGAAAAAGDGGFSDIWG